MESLRLLLHAHWDLEPFVPEDAPVFALSAFRFPLSAFQSGAHALILRVRPRYLKKWRSRGSNGLSVRNSR